MLDLVDYYALFFLAPFIFVELALPRRGRPPADRGWQLRGLAVSAVAYLASLGTGLIAARILPESSLFDGSALGVIGGALVGILVYELGHYAYHRAAHGWNWLWRAGHQLHHSAERLDAFGAYYLHPLDAALFTSVSIVVFFPLLGLMPESAAIAAAFLAFNAAFQHADVATPRWLGFIIQRPESHRIHHARGHHRSNYSDLPLWDWIFGTLDNPRDGAALPEDLGFAPGDSARLGELFVGKDITAG